MKHSPMTEAIRAICAVWCLYVLMCFVLLF